MSKHTWPIAGVFVLALSVAPFAQWGAGWQIPAGAEKEASPLKPTADVLKRGKAVFDGSCQKCHGPMGKGDGPDSDPRSPAADLTDEFRVDLNPDGVMYYRIFNGKPPVMPAFKSQLTRDEVWAVVEYAKSLRPKR
jgi:mono/diheme cytochrome c family protein